VPYIRKERTTRLSLPSDADYWVEMKDRASYGDKLAAQNSMLQVSQVDLALVEKAHMVEADIESGRGVLTEIEVDAFFKTLLRRLITDWNLDAEDGRIVPITLDAIEHLDSEDGEFLMTAARRRLSGRRAADERPFDGHSPQPSSDTKSLTETPSKP
jgi:glutaredoxin 2